MMAAMCLGFTAGREEEGFWIFTYLMEDVLGPEFFSRRPAMMGYHGDKAALAQLVASTMPELAERLGTAGLAECVSALAARCLLSGFVGFLSGEPLVAFWEELLANHWPDYPRLPLLLWFTGLVQHAERQLQQASAQAAYVRHTSRPPFCNPCGTLLAAFEFTTILWGFVAINILHHDLCVVIE
ncbi:unnamed protein product [Durusdinium trenchii]|uniref:Uncharacterized protein n=2 Tax=Durusdinium trenchii TaxID=1381693 RepID=A0ABP0N3V7_9DINO